MSVNWWKSRNAHHHVNSPTPFVISPVLPPIDLPWLHLATPHLTGSSARSFCAVTSTMGTADSRETTRAAHFHWATVGVKCQRKGFASPPNLVSAAVTATCCGRWTLKRGTTKCQRMQWLAEDGEWASLLEVCPDSDWRLGAYRYALGIVVTRARH